MYVEKILLTILPRIPNKNSATSVTYRPSSLNEDIYIKQNITILM